MSEVITISASHRSSHIVTHLYNNQEAHLAYSKDDETYYNNNTFLIGDKRPNGKIDYQPRGLLFEHRGGFGALNKYKYHEPEVNLGHQYKVIEVGERLQENEYQKNLDLGKNLASSLNKKNTKYWTDYNKLIYSPDSLRSLQDWQHNGEGRYGTHWNFPQQEFDTFNVGREEYAKNSDLYLEDFRKILEKTDLLQGMNLLTETDSAWSGFTAEYLIDLRDEYFNSGSRSKYSIWSYALMDRELPKRHHLYSRIASMVEMSENSTLYFPIRPNYDSPLFSSQFDIKSNWHTSAIPALFINSLWGLNNQLNGPTSMGTMEAELLGDTYNRNIINEIRIKPQNGQEDFCIIDNAIDIDNLLTLKIPDVQAPMDEIDLGASSYGKHVFIESVIAKHDQKKEVLNKNDQHLRLKAYENNRLDDIIHLDTFPSIFKNDKQLYTEMRISDGIKDDLKLYRKAVMLSKHTNVIEDKLELIEKISNLIDLYTEGYDESSEEFD